MSRLLCKTEVCIIGSSLQHMRTHSFKLPVSDDTITIFIVECACSSPAKNARATLWCASFGIESYNKALHTMLDSVASVISHFNSLKPGMGTATPNGIGVVFETKAITDSSTPLLYRLLERI